MHPLKNNYLTLKSKGQGPTKVITVRDTPPYGHAIDLSGKTKKLWSGQASLRISGRRSGRRKNQTKTICLPSFEWET